MSSFSAAGYFLTCVMIFVHFLCFERLAVFDKITASRSSYLFLQKTVTNPTMSQNKAINENLRTFNFMQNKKILIANILKVKTFD